LKNKRLRFRIGELGECCRGEKFSKTVRKGLTTRKGDGQDGMWMASGDMMHSDRLVNEEIEGLKLYHWWRWRGGDLRPKETE